MDYRAVQNRCAVDIAALKLPISREKTLAILFEKGFKRVEADLVALARECIGRSEYRRGSSPHQAPAVVDCSSFMKWLYGMRGIWLPRRSIQQLGIGEAIELSEVIAGDLIFMSGYMNYYVTDPREGVGHVGVATGEGTVIHAANRRAGVIETSLERFVGKEEFRGARRYIPKDREVLTFETPLARCVETADDIKWIVLQSLD